MCLVEQKVSYTLFVKTQIHALELQGGWLISFRIFISARVPCWW